MICLLGGRARINLPEILSLSLSPPFTSTNVFVIVRFMRVNWRGVFGTRCSQLVHLCLLFDRNNIIISELIPSSAGREHQSNIRLA